MIKKIDEKLLEEFGYKKYNVPSVYTCDEFWQKRLFISEDNYVCIDIKVYYLPGDDKQGYEFESQFEIKDDNAFNVTTCQWYRPGYTTYTDRELLKKVDKFFTALYIFSKTTEI